MSTTKTATSLTWKVFVTKRPGLARDLPPGKERLLWVANSSTLIAGERDAVLVDAFLTTEHSRTLADWVVASGKNLVAIYVTHGHGDHFFGLPLLLERFPHAKPLATPEIVKAMQAQLAPETMDGFWRSRFPGQIPEHPQVAEPLIGRELELEGHKLVAIDTGWTDTACSTSLHLPSQGLIVAGDVVYNGIHPYLAETDTQSRLNWIAALDKLEALQPTTVIAGHKVPENDDDPRDIGRTRQYLRDFNRLDATTTSARELYDAMIQLHPDRANPGSLWTGAQRAKQRV
jgi:glyoxylase-like metal-dependent hydrolase (beta-lactamase superfamily II)